MGTLLVLPSCIDNVMDDLEEDHPDVHASISQFDRVGYWDVPSIINPEYDLVWMMENGLAELQVSSEGEFWGIDIQLWSISEQTTVNGWDMKLSDLVWLNSVVECAHDVN